MAELIEITAEECWDLLEGSSVCRLAWNDAEGPIVLPLNYVVHEHALWLRTSAHSTASQEIDDDPVALLVDEFDADTQVGWSVQIRGAARVHYSLDGVPEEVQRLRTWAEGARPLWIKVEAHSINGRRLVED